jgi:hypothetical protein
MPKRGGARWPGAVKEDGGTTRIGWREVGDKADGRGPHGDDRGRKDVMARMCNPKEKVPFGEYTMAVQAEWAAWGRRRPMGAVGQHGLVVLDPRRRLKGR